MRRAEESNVAQEYFQQVRLKEHFLSVWKKALKYFLGCSNENVAEFANKHKDGLDTPFSLLYREEPLSYIVPLLIPARLQMRMTSSEELKLQRRLNEVLSVKLERTDIDTEEWIVAKAHIVKILAEYGETLPRVESEKA